MLRTTLHNSLLSCFSSWSVCFRGRKASAAKRRGARYQRYRKQHFYRILTHFIANLLLAQNSDTFVNC